jgi:DNA-binding GntR family transcriptional regulator
VPPEVQRPLPPYMQIVDHFRELIKKGELRPGDRLPSARQLTVDWNVAIATAAKVLTTLRAEGYVITTPGGAGGTLVAPANGHAPRDRMLAVRRFGRIYPDGEHARIVSAELVPAPGYVTDALSVAPGASAIRRRRITFRGSEPISASTSWFAEELGTIAPALLVAERIKVGTPGYIEQQTGRVLSSGRDHVCAGAADEQAAADLGVEIGSPVLLGRNWVRDADDDVVEFGEYVTLSGQWQAYEYDLT